MTEMDSSAENPTIEPGLHIVSTPVGRARDITLHALDVLRAADVLVAEDTRVLRKLLSIHGVPIGGRSVLSHHEHSKAGQVAQIARAFTAGKSVAYASDAGTPVVSDPGYSLVQAALEAGTKVHSAPGASALLAALVVSALPTDRVLFAGFFPTKKTARLAELSRITSADWTSVYYESPKRILSSLEITLEVLGPDRPVVVARELTKRHEQILREPLGALVSGLKSGAFSMPEKGEIVFLIGPSARQEISDADINVLLDGSDLTEGVNVVAQRISTNLGVPKRRVYNLALQRTKHDSG